MHWVDGLAVDWELAPIWERYPADDVWGLYAERAVRRRGERDLRLDGAPRPGQGVRAPAGPEPQALYEQIADAFQAAGVCAEVSTAGYRRALDELYPDPELLRDVLRARACR